MAATQPIFHSDQLGDAIMVGENLSLAKGTGLLLDADVGAGKTLVTMQAALITNAATKAAEFQGYVGRLSRSFDLGAALSILTTANIQGVTTIAELVAITPSDPAKVGGPIFLE